MNPERERRRPVPVWAEALKFARSLIVGSLGTALDFAVLSLSLRVLHFDATWARAAGLCVSAVALFFGSRSYAFRARSESAARQARRFVVAELVGFPLSILAFRALVGLLPNVTPELLGLLANFALFVSYYYPVRRLIVFRAPDAAPPVSTAPAPAALAKALPAAVVPASLAPGVTPSIT